VATKIFGEIDLKGNLRAVEKKGFNKCEPIKVDSLSKIQPSNLTASITDSSVMDRIYLLPHLKGNQLKLALQQKLRRDLEFIADITELEWIYSSSKKKTE